MALSLGCCLVVLSSHFFPDLTYMLPLHNQAKPSQTKPNQPKPNQTCEAVEVGEAGEAGETGETGDTGETLMLISQSADGLAKIQNQFWKVHSMPI